MKKLIVWVALTLLLEISGLYILNNFVFIDSLKFNSKKIELKKDISKDINASISSDAENIDLSYEGKYLIYSKEKTLYIEQAQTGQINEIKTEDSEEIMCYKWLDNRDLIAMVEKVKKDGVEKVQLITYNPANSTKTLVKEICKYEKNMVVNNMTTSVLTNVYYIHINKGGSRNVVYRVDRNEDITKVDIKTNILANMQVIPHEDRLVYEDKINSRFFATSPNKQLTFNTNKKLTLLSIDRNDVIYMGEIDGDKIGSIVYGKVSENTADWKRITLDSAISRNSLYFTSKSKILINKSIEGIVKNLTDDNEIKYDGKLIQIKDGFIVTVNENGKLKYENY